MTRTLAVVPSAAESARFSVATGRLDLTDFAAANVASLAGRVNDALAACDATIVILRYPAEALALAARLDAHRDWVSFPGGSLLYWEAPAEPAVAPDVSAAEVAPGERTDLQPELSRVLLDSFHDYVNHYAANPLIAPGATEAGYEAWARAILADGANRLFVVRDGDVIAGAAVVTTDDEWDIRLAGIASAAQGRGLYRRLIARVSASAAAEGVRLVISTQAHNIAVQRAWASFGWRPVSAIETVHLVRRRALA